MDKGTVEATVEAVIRQRFSDSLIRSVDVSHDVDDEGDPILRIVVVLTGAFNAADEQKMLGLVRHIRSEIIDSGESGFPIVNFISTSDAAKRRRETA